MQLLLNNILFAFNMCQICIDLSFCIMDIHTVFLLLSFSRYSQIIRFVNVQILSFCSTFSGLGFGHSTFTFSQANFLCPLALLFFFFLKRLLVYIISIVLIVCLSVCLCFAPKDAMYH